jgi:hypothetical protein
MNPIRFLSTWLLALTLIVPAEARHQTPKEQATKIPLGSLVLVQMKTGQGVNGRLREVTSTEFTLEPLTPQNAPRQTFLFDDVRSIEPPKTQRFPRSPVEFLAAIPAMVICGAERIFKRNGCDEL